MSSIFHSSFDKKITGHNAVALSSPLEPRSCLERSEGGSNWTHSVHVSDRLSAAVFGQKISRLGEWTETHASSSRRRMSDSIETAEPGLRRVFETPRDETTTALEKQT